MRYIVFLLFLSSTLFAGQQYLSPSDIAVSEDGLVRVLQVLDMNDSLRPKYVTQFKEMCSRLADIQSDQGLWHPGLLDPEAHRQPETSGTAFFVYAMAYGINEGILDRDKFMPVINKAWAGLCRHLKDDGRFTGIQPVGDSPRKYNKDNTTNMDRSCQSKYLPHSNPVTLLQLPNKLCLNHITLIWTKAEPHQPLFPHKWLKLWLIYRSSHRRHLVGWCGRVSDMTIHNDQNGHFKINRTNRYARNNSNSYLFLDKKLSCKKDEI